MTQDYAGKNLRGKDFQGKNFEKCDFKDCDIRGTNFTNANLKGANFHGAKAGLEPYWAIGLVIISFILVELLVSLLLILGNRTAQTILSTNTGTTPETIGDNIWVAVIILVMIAVFIYYIFKNLETAFKITVGVGIAAISLTLFIGVIQAGVGVASGNTTESITGSIIRFLARNTTGVVIGIGIGFVAVAIAVVIVIAKIVGGNEAKALISFATWFMVIPPALFLFKSGGDIRAIIVGIVLSFVVVFLGNYLVSKALSDKQEYALVLNIAVFFSCIGGTSFRGADLTGADFTTAILKSTDFRNSDQQTNLTHTCFYNAQNLNYARTGNTILVNPLVRDLLINPQNGQNKVYDGANFRGAYLRGANLTKASLKGADISNATFQGACLEDANLTLTQAVGTDFTSAHMTGACLEAWNIEHTTKLDYVDCRCVYLLENNKPNTKYRERRPSSGEFAQGEFTTLFKEVFNTVDLIFQKGIDWKAFMLAFDNVRTEIVKTEGTEIVVQGIENKGDGVFVVRVAVPDDANKENIHLRIKQEYQLKLREQKQYYKSELKIKDVQIEDYLRENTNLSNILKAQEIIRNYNINTSHHRGDIIMPDGSKKESHNNFSGAQFAGGFVDAETVNAEQIGGNINNYPIEQKQNLAEAAADIKKLLEQLEQTYPTEILIDPDVVAKEAIKQIKSNPPLNKRIVNVIKAMGVEALKEAIDHPVANIMLAGVQEWREPK